MFDEKTLNEQDNGKLKALVGKLQELLIEIDSVMILLEEKDWPMSVNEAWHDLLHRAYEVEDWVMEGKEPDRRQKPLLLPVGEKEKRRP